MASVDGHAAGVAHQERPLLGDGLRAFVPEPRRHPDREQAEEEEQEQREEEDAAVDEEGDGAREEGRGFELGRGCDFGFRRGHHRRRERLGRWRRQGGLDAFRRRGGEHWRGARRDRREFARGGDGRERGCGGGLSRRATRSSTSPSGSHSVRPGAWARYWSVKSPRARPSSICARLNGPHGTLCLRTVMPFAAMRYFFPRRDCDCTAARVRSRSAFRRINPVASTWL